MIEQTLERARQRAGARPSSRSTRPTGAPGSSRATAVAALTAERPPRRARTAARIPGLGLPNWAGELGPDDPRDRAALIVLHELGHFSAAKAVGMRVERFSLFFPPTPPASQTGRDRVRDRRDPRGRLREDHRHEPGGDRGARSRGRAPRLLQPAALEADRGDPRGPGREHPDRLRAVLGGAAQPAPSTARCCSRRLDPSVQTRRAPPPACRRSSAGTPPYGRPAARRQASSTVDGRPATVDLDDERRSPRTAAPGRSGATAAAQPRRCSSPSTATASGVHAVDLPPLQRGSGADAGRLRLRRRAEEHSAALAAAAGRRGRDVACHHRARSPGSARR